MLEKTNDRLEAIYDNPNALRDYFRDIGRMVLAAEGRKANDSHADCYQYFCVPEYGTANGRLHFHAVHFMRTLPTGSVDPNFFFLILQRPPLSTLFPYTTLFRSWFVRVGSWPGHLHVYVFDIEAADDAWWQWAWQAPEAPAPGPHADADGWSYRKWRTSYRQRSDRKSTRLNSSH